LPPSAIDEANDRHGRQHRPIASLSRDRICIGRHRPGAQTRPFSLSRFVTMTPQPVAERQTSQLHNAYLAIENKIVTLEFRPGAMLTEKAIIDAVGFGRTPVREALQRLTLEGLTEVHPRLGVKIADIRPEDYPRAIEPRLTLEPLLARSAARYAGPWDRETIAKVMHDMLDCARRNDVVGFLQPDKALDEAVAAAAATASSSALSGCRNPTTSLRLAQSNMSCITLAMVSRSQGPA